MSGLDEMLASGLPFAPSPRRRPKPKATVQPVHVESIVCGDVVIHHLAGPHGVAAIKQWPHPYDLRDASEMFTDDAGNVVGGQWRPDADGGSPGRLGRAVRAAGREALGLEGLRMLRPRKASRVRRRYAVEQGVHR